MKPTLLLILLSVLLAIMPGPLVAAARPKAPRQPVDLNTATATELMQLPRVGPAMAARILGYRKANGPFSRPEELLNIKGIGEKGFLRLRPFVTVDGRPSGSEGAPGPVPAPGAEPVPAPAPGPVQAPCAGPSGSRARAPEGSRSRAPEGSRSQAPEGSRSRAPEGR